MSIVSDYGMRESLSQSRFFGSFAKKKKSYFLVFFLLLDDGDETGSSTDTDSD